MKIHTFLYVFLIIFSVSCSGPVRELAGTWNGGDEKTAYLYLVVHEFPHRVQLVDSARIENNRFVFSTAALQPQLYELGIGNDFRQPLFVEPVKMAATVNDAGKLEVSGSRLDSLLREHKRVQETIYRQGMMDSLDDARYVAVRKGDQQEADRIWEEIARWRGIIVQEERALARQWVDGNKDNALGVYLYLTRDFFRRFFPTEEDVARERTFLSGFGSDAQKSPLLRQMQDKLVLFEGCMVGADAPEITGTTPEGHQKSLGDLRGQYVIVDFWASWCVPCRAETPYLKRALERFSPLNMTILGVSSDRNREDWVNAIEEDQSNWHHIILGADSDVHEKYCVNGIPHIILVGPDGKIEAKDLRHEQMMDILAKHISL